MSYLTEQKTQHTNHQRPYCHPQCGQDQSRVSSVHTKAKHINLQNFPSVCPLLSSCSLLLWVSLLPFLSQHLSLAAPPCPVQSWPVSHSDGVKGVRISAAGLSWTPHPPQHMCCHSQGQWTRTKEMRREVEQLLAEKSDTEREDGNFFKPLV